MLHEQDRPEAYVHAWVYEETNGMDGLQRQDSLRRHVRGRIAGDAILS